MSAHCEICKALWGTFKVSQTKNHRGTRGDSLRNPGIKVFLFFSTKGHLRHLGHVRDRPGEEGDH